MRLHFGEQSLNWLDFYIKQLITVSSRTKGMESVERIARKMRYKFTGTPSVVFLTGKERALIRELAEHRWKTVEAQPTEERNAVKSVLDSIERAERGEK